MARHDEFANGSDLSIDLSIDLPPLDPDEPAGLRAEIIDEIRDHLLSSLQKELLTSEDREEVEQNVLQRFGDPAATVRRLWLTAMWSRLMIRNVTLVTSLLALAAGLTAVWMVRELAIEFRDSTAATRQLVLSAEATNRTLIDNSRKQNQLVVDRLTDLAGNTGDSERSAIWNPLRFRLVSDSPSKEPAVGFEVEIRGNLHTESQEVSMNRTSDEAGLVDFGIVRPGSVSFNVTSPWLTGSSGHFDVLPRTEHEQLVVCPGAPPEPVNVELVVEWPPFMQNRTDVAAVIELTEGKARSKTRTAWRSHRSIVVLAYPDGTVQHLAGSVQMERSFQSRKPLENPLGATVGMPRNITTIYSESEMLPAPVPVHAVGFSITSISIVDVSTLKEELISDDETQYHKWSCVAVAPNPLIDRISGVSNSSMRGYAGSEPRNVDPLSFDLSGGESRFSVPLPESQLLAARVAFALRDAQLEGELERGTHNLAAAVDFFKVDADADGSVTDEEFQSSTLGPTFSRGARLDEAPKPPWSFQQYLQRYHLSRNAPRPPRS